ncbi:hypothetical protein LPB90_10585 [Chryseobacterium sp. LC2016-29]|uniref:hypothetical protein n=1 Tax=Chryseobacterium sp. LC2016-29 TaxID=2897331 RepID=UPI001E5D3F89|nr:hypothetical protein [Chryseobacterium sp. LC2016-29]MCD0478906.1 hypothetical protein [Chryseobacterium sp. LC2016-29]
MKKQLFIALSLTVLSLLTVNCSSSNDDDNTQQTNPTTTQYFHPPTWIQGTWGVTNGTTSNKLYKFAVNDFILLATGVSEQSMTGAIKAHPYGGSVDETSNTSTLYIFDIKYNNSGVTQHFEFKKISATQIQLKDNSNNTWTDLVKM